MNDRQYIEVFHLLFLDRLGRKLDKSRYVLRGDCNLRFFFRSIRYSEDMDIDVRTEPPHVLRDKVNGILKGKPMQETLQAREMEIEHVTESKQTDTVQRWKLGLRVGMSDRILPTKIEFSRRTVDPGVRFEGVDAALIRDYRLAPILANHYDEEAAVRQKLEALRSRKAPQARDVFDLHLLWSGGVDIGKVARDMGASLNDLQGRIMNTSYAVFSSQVLAYLPPDAQARYGDAHLWDSMVLGLADAIGETKA